MSSPIAIPSSKVTSYASAVASSPTTSVTMCSPSSSLRSAGFYVPMHKRLSASLPRALPSEAASSLPRSHRLTYTPSFLLSLRPTAEAFKERIKLRIRASLEPELADLVLEGQRMKKASASRKTRRKAGGLRQGTAAPSSSSSTLTSMSTSTPTPLTRSLLSNTRPTFTTTSTKPNSSLSSNKTTVASRRTRSSSIRARPPRQMLHLSRTTTRIMNSRDSWRGSGAPALTGVDVV